MTGKTGGDQSPEGALEGINVKSSHPLLTPIEVKRANPITERGATTVLAARQAVHTALDPSIPPDKLVVVLGPCSVHDVDQSLEYADWLRGMRAAHRENLELIQRVYFEKSRSGIGWEGFVTDPHLDETFDMNYGLMKARSLLRDINDQGVPAGTEWVDTFTPKYYEDLISWAAIGARTVESPLHRRLASGLSSPVGFKNSVGGDVQLAVNAAAAASHPRHIIVTTEESKPTIVETTGNSDSHIILRGGSEGPNYSQDHVEAAAEALAKADLPQRLMVDASHGNSNKDHRNQRTVVRDVADQITAGSSIIMGVMIESNLKAGKQPFTPDAPGEYEYGVSITDSCVGLEETDVMLKVLAEAVETRRSQNSA